MRLTVRYSPYYPPDRCWIWVVTGGYGERWTGWRPTYPEAVELGLEDLLAQDQVFSERSALPAFLGHNFFPSGRSFPWQS